MASGGQDSNVFSSDDEIVCLVEKRKRKPKTIVTSEEDESDSSDLEIKPKRTVKPLECESDEELNNFNNESTYSSDPKFCSDAEDNVTVCDLSDNEQTEKCAICLNKFSGQDIATPETCDHMFCLGCLQEWAKNVNTCPIDRLKFNLILIRHHKEEKIIKSIYINSPELPGSTDSESESNPETQVPSCDICEDNTSVKRPLMCNECYKTFHLECLLPALHSVNERITGSVICPGCSHRVRIKGARRRYRRFSNARNLRSTNPLLGAAQNSSGRNIWRIVAQRPSLVMRRLLSSDSSDDDMENTSHNTARLYQNQIAPVSKTRYPLLNKRRNEIYHTRNQALISSTSAATDSGLYSVDSDDGLTDYSYENGGSVLQHSGVNTQQSSPVARKYCPSEQSTADSRFCADSCPENYDVVGTILQSQTLLHCPKILTLKRDGTLLFNSDVNCNQRPLTSSTLSSTNDFENIGSNQSSVFTENNVSPYANDVVCKQRPLNPAQNTSSKYGEMPRQNYTCSSSTTSIEIASSYDVNIATKPSLGSNGDEPYSNDSCSPAIHKSFCSTSASEDIKKDMRSISSGLKEPVKGHHSEDEVDIYSDIESVGEEESIMNERVDSIKLPFKCEESQLSNQGDGSDSSDNELIIDEDMPVDEENEGRKDQFQSVTTTNNSNNIESKSNVDESEESNASSEHSDHEQHCNKTPDQQYPDSSYVNNAYNDDSQLEDESSQANNAYNNDSQMEDESSQANNAFNEDSQQEDESSQLNNPYNNDSQLEDDESQANNAFNDDSQLGDESSQANNAYDDSHSQLGDESSQEIFNEEGRVPEVEKNESGSDYDAQESDVDMQVYDENSCDSSKKSPGTKSSPHCSPESSPKLDTTESKHENFETQDDNSNISENHGYCDSSDFQNERLPASEDISQQVNENTNDSVSQTEEKEIDQNETNSNLSFESDAQNIEMSEPEDLMDCNVDTTQECEQVSGQKELTDICNESSSKLEEHEEDENFDSLENAATPCLDENIDGQIENSPIRNENLESSDKQSFHTTLLKSSEYNYEEGDVASSVDVSKTSISRNDTDDFELAEGVSDNKVRDVQEGAVDLGIEDISEAGSEDLDDDFVEDASSAEHKTQAFSDAEKDTGIFSNEASDIIESKMGTQGCSRHSSEDFSRYPPSSQSCQLFEDHEEGEIIEDKPPRRERKRGSKLERFHEDTEDYGELAPRVNISDLPRIPKIKRDREKDSIPEEIPLENKRTSVLGRVDLGGADISWKRLSKHTRERSYRDGRPKDERLMYRERESRNKDKKSSNDNEWRTDSKNRDSERRWDDGKKQDDKSKNEYESRSRKSEKIKDVKIMDWNYSEREKRKSHKEKHKDKHSKDKKDKYDKKYSKDDDKYEREKIKDEGRYERELRYDKEERFERIVYEKGKFKEHKSKHKDRKGDSSKSSKDHSREKHKHSHVSDHFSDKQREREVRKIDDKLKIVVEQKESRKDKSSKHKDRKEAKHDKKQLHHHDHRKKETERSPYTEMSSIESKEVFAKGDSIIINVNFNRASSPKDSSSIDNIETNLKDKKIITEDFDLDDHKSDDISKNKHGSDKGKDTLTSKRPVTPPERNPVLSVSECYWQGGEDTDGNNTPTSEKSAEEGGACVEENDTMESADAYDGDNFSNSCNSVDLPDTQTVTKDGESCTEEVVDEKEKIEKDVYSKENDTFSSSKRRSPRSPSPPSPVDNDSYDPCEPTRSPSPPPIPPAPPLPAANPKPPPSPELPPLPPEPEPTDIREDPRTHKQCTSTEFIVVSTVENSNSSQPVTVHTQTSMTNPLSLPSMMLPPPNFLSHASSTANSMPTISPLMPPRNFNFQVGSHPAVLFPPNHVQQVIRGNFVPTQMHAGSAIPPPPNPPNLPHMSSVPPPPPPPNAITLISQVRHPQMNVRPTIPPNSLLQNLTLAHTVNMPQMQITHLHHLPPNLSGTITNHQSPMMIPSQNQPTSLPVTIPNQQGPRVVLAQNQIPNHATMLQNQNSNSNNIKSQGSLINALPSHNLSLSNISSQKSEKLPKHSPPVEKTEVIDMEVDSPYSPGDSPSMDSVCDYSPTSSPVPSSPKNKDVFDSLLPADQRTSEKKNQEISTRAEKSKLRSESKNDMPSKKMKHEHKLDSGKVRHSVRMQVTDKNKSRKEQKLTEKKEPLSRLDDSQLKILDELPSSAVEMQVKEKFLKKLNRQERVVEEVKLALKPYYKSRDVSKEEYKDILRKSVPKICHNKSGEINPVKVKYLVECYVKKIKHSRKKAEKRKSSKFS